MRAAATSASLRSVIGVGPAWASCPVTVTSYQRCPWAPVTTPMVLPLVLQDRALLDMGLEIGADLPPADRGGAVVTDARELVAQQRAGRIVRPRLDLVDPEHAGEGARAHHRRREAAPLLVGPGGDFHRRVGLDPEIVEGADRLEPGEHAIGAVELAAGRLRIEMAAGHHWRQRVVSPGPPGKNVADPVHAHRAAGVLAPAHEQGAPGAVEDRSARAGTPRLSLRRADLGQLHQRRPQPVAVDPQVAHDPFPAPPPAVAIAPRRGPPQPSSGRARKDATILLAGTDRTGRSWHGKRRQTGDL